MKLLLLTLPVLFLNFSFSQMDTVIQKKDTTYWQFKAIAGINGTQTSFINWSAGGRNNISALGFIDLSLKYEKEDLKWVTDAKFALGGLKFMDSIGMKEKMQKTDDRVDLATSFGYEFKETWFYTFLGGFRTQSLDGYVFPNDSVRISKFMAPAYLGFAFGVEYAPSKSFNVFVSPLAAKITFVKDQTLADAGAFGVEKAVYDDLGNVLKHGLTQRNEFGSYLRIKFEKELMKNIEMKSKLELFSNYVEKPQNIDVNAEIIFLFKINKWFSSVIQWNLIYDDDISILDRNGKTGPRTQFKSLFGLGISYTIKNFK